jgi:hypothetical protein
MEPIRDKFWYEDISILFRNDRLMEFFVTQDQYTSEKLNAIVRFSFYLSLILAMYKQSLKYFGILLFSLVLTFFLWSGAETESKTAPEEVGPTLLNPYGNNSVFDDPKRGPMKRYTDYTQESLETKKKVDEYFNHNLYTDVGDLFGKQNSQRQFYTTPSAGQTPADPEGEFRNWLYGDMPSCKTEPMHCGKNTIDAIKRQPHYSGF